MTACPAPVIVVSSHNEDGRVFKALELGAVDFVAKPRRAVSEELLEIRDELQQKVGTLLNLNLARLKEQDKDSCPDRESSRKKNGQASKRRASRNMRLLPSALLPADHLRSRKFSHRCRVNSLFRCLFLSICLQVSPGHLLRGLTGCCLLR